MRFVVRSGFLLFCTQLFAISIAAGQTGAISVSPNSAQNLSTFPFYTSPESNPSSTSAHSRAEPARDTRPASPASSDPNALSASPFVAVSSSVEVRADDTLGAFLSPAYTAYREEIQSSAGTYGDYSRYLLLMPGVVGASNTDTMNDILVRGGHPSENLYVLDGMEIPYINHFTIEGTTSGFTPMLNTSTIEKVSLQPDNYDAQYSSRLSSLIEIQSREPGESPRSGEVNLGIAGLGIFRQSPLGSHATMLLAADRSLFNLATSNMGLDGVPIYTNGMARIEWKPDASNQISLLDLSGGDSISIAPCALDPQETLTIDTQYGGLRTNTGLIWLHTHNPTTVSKFTVSYAAQSLTINQQDQIVNDIYQRGAGGGCAPKTTTPVYGENTLDQLTTFGYDLRHDFRGWLVSAGAAGQLVQLNYQVAQPAGIQSPFNPNPYWSDSDSFHASPTSTQTGSFAEITGPYGRRWMASAGIRLETFGLTQAHAWEPHYALGIRLTSHQAVHASYRQSAQLPPYMDILSYAQNRALTPMRVEQFSLGADLWRASDATLSLEAYRKRYTNEPASTEYPSLTLSNMVYQPGDEMYWLPLISAGKGKASGLELSLRGHWEQHVSALASLTYARVQYAALDGVYRAGNYDVPLVGNGLLIFHLPRTWNLSIRNSYMTGRPYTPYNIPLSVAEARGIYDLTKVNALRGPAYNRADISFDRNFHLPTGVLNLYGGVQNLFDRKNFLGYVWLSQCNQMPNCMASMHGIPMMEVYQMPAFPVAGLRWDF